MILVDTILKRLNQHVDALTLARQFDVRYMQRWIREYPQCFPTFMLENKFSIFFNNKKMRYEIIKHETTNKAN